MGKVQAQPAPLGIDLEVGQLVPAHCTALGKVLLAHLPKEALEEVIRKEGLPRYTSQTITDRAVFERSLRSVRREGSALDDEEFRLGLRCIAAPIRRGRGEVIAAMSVAGPSSRFTLEKAREYREAVIDSAHKASISLGIRAA